MPHVHPRQRRARAAVVTALALLPALCLGLNAAVDRAYPDWDDVEQAVVMARLRDRVAEFPDRPLDLVLGSSRAMMAFDTDGMSADSHGPVVVNLSLCGCHPLTSLLQLRRVVAEGFRPRGVILEVIPIWMSNFADIRQKGHLTVDRYRTADLPILRRIAPEWAPRLWRDWAVFNACRWHTLRADLMAEALPAFAAKDRVGLRVARDKAVSPHGWYPVQLDPVPPEKYAKGLQDARCGYEALLRELDRIDPLFDAVMGEFFAYCREQGIAVRAVVFTPEGVGFRAFYGPGVQRRMADHLDGLCRRHGSRLIDTREWMPDDCFLDGHHMIARGARAFTRRFQAEVAEQGTNAGAKQGLAREAPRHP